MKISIFRQLFISYGAVFLFLIVSLFSVSYFELSHYLNNVASKEILLSTSLNRGKLESTLDQHLVNLKSWAKLELMNDFLTSDADLRITKVLESFHKQYSLKGHLYALTPNGNLIASDIHIPYTRDLNDWLIGINSSQHIIDKHINPYNKKTVIALWQPVYASFNPALNIGYLIMTYPWDEIVAIQDNTGVNTHVLLFNRGGELLVKDQHLPYIPNIKMLQKLVVTTPEMSTNFFEKNVKKNNAKVMLRHEVELGVPKKTYFVHELSQTAKTPLTNLWSWYSFNEKAQFYAPMMEMMKTGLIIVFATLTLTILIIFIVSRKISIPIRELTLTAVNIAKTLDLSQRIPIYGKNELSHLASAFNDMCLNLDNMWQEKKQAALALEAINQTLELKVVERTEHLAWQATHDPLTELPNRALLSERLTQAISRANRDKVIIAIMFIDLDGFKVVNDTHGHEQGDYLLKELADRLRRIIREPDTIARFGGDEFVLLLQINDLKDLDKPIQRIVQLINAPIKTQVTTLSVSSSIGITLYPDDASDADALIRHADQAMYDSKQKGRNQVQFFNVEMDYKINNEYKKREQIKKALRRQELILHYQPQVNLHTGQVIGAEALIRWQHPKLGLIFPDDFLPYIEECDLIIEVGQWVIQKAFQQLRSWNQLGLKLKLSINIACRHIQHPHFIEELMVILSEYPDVEPSQLVIEITESGTIEDIINAKAILQSCIDHNIQIALDDFGTGYSSLTYLRELPFSLLKIDKSFVKDMLIKREDKAIVESIISLATIFHQRIVAEGIETNAHYLELKTMNCTYGQGYGISKPLPSTEFLTWVDLVNQIHSL